MVKAIGISLCALIFFAAVHSAHATVLNFDDLTDQAAVPSGYNGFNWTNMFGEHWDTNLDAGTGFENGSVGPGTGVVFNGNGTQGTVVTSPTSTKFNFVGAYLTGAWNDGLNVTVTAFLNSVQVDTQTVTTSFSAPTFFEFDFNNIDTLKFTSSGGTQAPNVNGSGTEFVMDNFTYTIVPEPSTLVLLSLGACGLLYRRRRA
jgi:hypothetical protein